MLKRFEKKKKKTCREKSPFPQYTFCKLGIGKAFGSTIKTSLQTLTLHNFKIYYKLRVSLTSLTSKR